MKFCRLENTQGNHNKFYEMKELPGGLNFESKYGKMGSRGNICAYPMNDWQKIYSSKIAKGYVDVTPSKTTQQIKDFEYLQRISDFTQKLSDSDCYVDMNDIEEMESIINRVENESCNLSKEMMNRFNEIYKKYKSYL